MRTSDAHMTHAGLSGRPAATFARWRRYALAAVAGAALLVSGAVLSGMPGSALAAEKGSGQADLDLLRQFHSYAPARSLSRKAGKRAGRKQQGAKLLRKARAALRTGDYKRARKLFTRAYKAGAMTAAWYLGYLHGTGRGGKVNHAKAFEYYRALARRFDPDEHDMRRLTMSVDALVRVADYYRTGIGKKVRRDLLRAFRLYNMAAAYNHPGAYYGMAMVALKSNGRIAHKRWVVGWLKRAAMSGHAPAAWQLSRLAATGLKGVFNADPVAAEAWRIVARRLEGPTVRAGKGGRNIAMRRLRLSDAQREQALRLASQFLQAYTRARRVNAGMALPARPNPPAAPTAPVAASTAPLVPRK